MSRSCWYRNNARPANTEEASRPTKIASPAWWTDNQSSKCWPLFVGIDMVKTLEINEPLYKIICQLGEGPLWDEAQNVLHFVDVGKNCIHHLDLTTNALSSDYYNECIASISFCKRNSNVFLAAARGGFAYLPIRNPLHTSPSNPGTIEYMCENPVPEELRDARMFNDSACDARGRIFSGSKTLRGQPFYEDQLPGRIYRLENDGKSWKSEEVAAAGHMTVPNGIAFSPDNKIMYIADTRSFEIVALDYDLETGTASNKRVFVRTTWDGRPDGMCVDTEGHVWSAKYAGARVTRYTPSGEVDMEVHFPKSLNITSAAFGGPERDTLYVTSGSLNESGDDTDAEKVARYPDSGAIFAVKIPGVRGIGKYRFADI